MEVDDSWHGTIRFDCRWINIDIEGQIPKLLVGYGVGCRFRHRREWFAQEYNGVLFRLVGGLPMPGHWGKR